MSEATSPETNIVRVVDGIPFTLPALDRSGAEAARVTLTDLAATLGYSDKARLKDLASRHSQEIAEFGDTITVVVPVKAGFTTRNVEEPTFNPDQAAYLALSSETAAGRACRVRILKAYKALLAMFEQVVTQSPQLDITALGSAIGVSIISALREAGVIRAPRVPKPPVDPNVPKRPVGRPRKVATEELPPLDTAGVESFLELWWEKWKGEEKYVDELEELYSASPATFDLRKSTQRGRQTQIGILLTRLSGMTVGRFKLLLSDRDRKGRQPYRLEDARQPPQPELPTEPQASPPVVVPSVRPEFAEGLSAATAYREKEDKERTILFKLWWARWENAAVYATEVATLITDNRRTFEQLIQQTTHRNQLKIGMLLASLDYLVYGPYRLIKVGADRVGRQRYRLVETGARSTS